MLTWALSRVSYTESWSTVEEDLSSQELRRLVGEFDLLVASRFHSMVSALVMGTPDEDDWLGLIPEIY